MRIGWCGAGRMGALMAGRLLTDGHEITVYNRTPQRTAPLVAGGARLADSPAAAAEGADAVVLVLFGPDSVADVLTGPDGVLAAADRPPYVIDTTTIAPADARRFAADCAERGVAYLDAPLFGSIDAAAAGTVQTWVGGTAEQVAAITPVLRGWCAADGVHHAGPTGSGAAIKIVRNMAHAIATAGIGEALRLAADVGVDRDEALAAIGAGPFAWTMAQKAPSLAARDFSEVAFSVDLLAKDARLAIDGAARPMPLTTAAWQWATDASAAGDGALDYPAVAAFIEEIGTEPDG
jgi:3-hydroxyisobutyrate dehydrogenase-like beta-hydroxyacid dehydrogenase